MIVVSVAGKLITVRAKRGPVVVVATFETGHGVIIPVSMSDADGTQSVEIVMNELQDFFEAFARIAKQFTNLQGREAFEQRLEARNGEQVIIAVGWGEGASKRPEEKKAIIQKVEGFGFVSKVVLSAWQIGCLAWFWGIGISTGLVGTGIINISGLGVTPGSKTTMFKTGGCVASTAFLRDLARRASAPRGRLGAGRNLVAAVHV